MAATAVATKWHYKAEYFELCNCAAGCPCNFTGFPTTGQCRAVVTYRITEGMCGDVNLAGVTIVMAVEWPGAIHEGNGTVAVFFDPSATEKQMEAVAGIFTNAFGGLPHEIIATTISEMIGPFVEPIDFKFDGPNSSVRIGTKIIGEGAPYRSPIEPYDEQEVRVVLPTGFIWQDAHAIENVRTKVSVDGLKFEDQRANGFYAIVEHHN